MKQSIIRVAKIKTKGVALGKTKHNYRLMDTPNADPDRTTRLNEEYINHKQVDYWTLAEQRIQEGVSRKVREDQVRAMEVLLTASPEWFTRDASGQVPDMRGHRWVQDNLDFLQSRYGKENLLSFTLHQDEKTPHIHAVIVPITEKGRLSADALFNPRTLKQLQTDYANAMSHHGLERGMEGSRRAHQDMKQVYGRQEATVQEVAPLLPAPSVQRFVLDVPPLMGREAWRDAQEAKINAEIARQVGEVANRLQEVGKVAVANAGAREQAERLETRLRTSEGLNQRNYQAALHLQKKLVETTEAMGLLAVDVLHRNRAGFDVIKLANQTIQAGEERAKIAAQKSTKEPFLSEKTVFDRLARHGFDVGQYEGKNGPEMRVEEAKTGLQYPLEQIFPHLAAQVEEHKRAQELAERRALASAPGAHQLVITAQPELMERLKAAFERVGGNAWEEQSQAGVGQLRVVYRIDYQTIEQMEGLVAKVKVHPQVDEVYESAKDSNARREAIRFLNTPLGQDLHGRGRAPGKGEIERD